ncbi:MAG: hydroxyacid dehydrogenase [Lachnospiraceae bacterium]|nr:hydroxyacid dehydrogenase [Lachnospiraceae bacterium]
MGFKVLVPQAIAKEGMDDLKRFGYEVKMGSGAKEEDLIRDVVDCDAILLRTAPVTRAVLEAGKKLKIVARHGAGYNNVDLEAASELGIWVTNAPDSTTNSVAEFTVGAIIAAAKRTFLLNAALKKEDFYFKNTHKGMDLIGKTVGIVGLGRIGGRTAQKLHDGMDMKILAYDPYANPDKVPEYVKLTDWDTLFKESDFVSLHMPSTKDNRGCVGKREFDMMKESAYFINCARGEIVDQAALTDALKENQIAGAFLDVLESEPFDKNWPLLNMDNVIVTPHMASNTEECMMLMATQAASQIHLVLSGEKPTWPVNTPKGKNE